MRLRLILLFILFKISCLTAIAVDTMDDSYKKVTKSYDISSNTRVYLNKNNGFLTQEMFDDTEGKPLTNTIFIIQYDYNLDGDITIPDNSTIEFVGGSISGKYSVTGRNTVVKADLIKIFDSNLSFKGSWNIKETYPEWFGAVGDNPNIDNSEALNACMHSYLSHTIVFSKLYYIACPVYCCYGTLFKGCGGSSGIAAKIDFHPIKVSVNGQSRDINALLYTPNAYFDPQFEHLVFDGQYVCETVCETFNFAVQFRYSDCLVQRFYGVGIYLAFSDNAYVRNTYVRYCNIGIGFGNKRINIDNPWDFSGEYKGKTNHVLLDNNNVEHCNIGVFAVGGADMTITNHLSGHNALWAFYCNDLYNVLIDEFYSEDDFRCNFFIKKNMTKDPSLNSDKTFNKDLYSFFNKSPKQRALMFLGGNCSYVINTLQLGLYNLRLYEGCNTNLLEDDSLSGIDAIIHAGAGLLGGVTINSKWLINTYYKENKEDKNEKPKYNKYDICTNMRGNVTPNITSLASLRILNYNLVREDLEKAPIVDRIMAINGNSPQNLTLSASDNNYFFLYTGKEKNKVNDGDFKFVKTVSGIDFYARSPYAHQINSIRIDPSTLDGGCTYAAIIHYYDNSNEAKKEACGIDFWVRYAENEDKEFRPCYYTPSLGSKQLLTCIIYFTKEDFIKNGKLAQYLYFSEREGGCSLMSSPVSIWKVGSQEGPVSLSFKESGNSNSRPSPDAGEEIGLVYFDTTLGKPIYWTGNTTLGDNGWVDAMGRNPNQ